MKKWYSIFTIILLSVSIRASSFPARILNKKQHIPTSAQSISSYKHVDSLALARQKHIRDSLKVIADSLTFLWVKQPSPSRPNLFLDSVIKVYQVDNLNFEKWSKKFPKKKMHLLEGQTRPQRELWILGVIVCLVLLFALIKNIFSKHLNEIVYLFYTNQSPLRTHKDDHLLNSWISLFLYILFAFTFGMCFYLSVDHQIIPYGTNFQKFLIFSVMMLLLFIIKVIVLWVVAFIFDIKKLVKEHIITFYLFLANSSLIYLPIVVIFSLLPYSLLELYSYISIVLLGVIYIFQFFRVLIRMTHSYQFSIIYLFIYLCVLEICPLIFLLKVLSSSN